MAFKRVKLFLLSGVTGGGKDSMCEHLRAKYPTLFSVLHKNATRKPRSRDESVATMSCEAFEAYLAEDFCYGYDALWGDRYAFRKKDLDVALTRTEFVVVIVADDRLIDTLIAAYPDVEVVPIWVYSHPADIAARLKQEGHTDTEITDRLDRTKFNWQVYENNRLLYRHVIMNVRSRVAFEADIDAIVAHYRSMC